MRTVYNVETGETTIDESYVLDPAELPRRPKVQSVTARQARLWLLSKGLNDMHIRAALSSLPKEESERALVEWEYSTQIYRGDERVTNILRMVLRLSDDEIDKAFEEAAKL